MVQPILIGGKSRMFQKIKQTSFWTKHVQVIIYLSTVTYQIRIKHFVLYAVMLVMHPP